MSSLTSRTATFILMGLLLLGGACSDARTGIGGFNPDNGRHQAGWVPADHATTVSAAASPEAGSAACAECHGADLGGGISGVSCSICHLGGPYAVHPSTWTLLYKDHGPYADANGMNACANQYCHGANLEGVQNSGPSCTYCHSIPYDPSTLICAACHRIPPDGTSYPNVAGRHAVHATSDTTTCSICHNGAGGMTTNSYHENGVGDVFFQSAYKAKSGAASYNSAAYTCANVICHGGQATPNWLTGTIDVNTQCSSCHASGTSQYNSYNSGHHTFHLGEVGAVCTDCHDTTKLASVHFVNLSSTTMTGAYLTLKSALNYTGTGTGTGTCTINCHGENHDRRSW